MPHRVVDVLEVVEIEEKHRNELLVAAAHPPAPSSSNSSRCLRFGRPVRRIALGQLLQLTRALDPRVVRVAVDARSAILRAATSSSAISVERLSERVELLDAAAGNRFVRSMFAKLVRRMEQPPDGHHDAADRSNRDQENDEQDAATDPRHE